MKNLVLIFCLSCFCSVLLAQDRVAFDTLYQRVNRLPSIEVIRLADDYLKKAQEDTAIVLYSIAYSRFNNEMSEEEKLLCALSYHKTANIYFVQGNYTSALDFYIKGMKICESCRDKRLLPQFYLSLGNIYCTFQDYEKGISCYKKGYELCETYPNKQYEYNLLTNLAGAYNNLNNASMAKMYNDKAIRMTRPSDTIKHYMNLLNGGLILANEKKYKDAIHTFRYSADYARESRIGPRYECSSYEELSKVYRSLDNNDSALHYMSLCNQIADKSKLVDILARNLKMYSDFYEKEGDSKRALLYKSKYLSLSDSIFNVREFNRIKNTQYLYEMDKIGKEIFSLNIEKERKEQKIKVQQKVLAGILAGLLSITGLLFWVYKQKRKLSCAYKNLFNVNKEIMASDSFNKKLRNEYEEKLHAAYQELSLCRKLDGESLLPLPAYDLTERTESGIRTKYQASNLTDKQKQLLLDSVNQVMETTKEFCEEDFSLEKLSTLVNSNSKYISQVINETYHKNFNIYINEYRIREARIRLADIENYGNYTIKAVAESVGYKSHATFVNAFRNITGIMPSMFQKMIREEQSV